MARLSTGAAALGLALALLVGGCGGSSHPPSTSTQAASAPASQGPPPTIRSESRGLRGKLRRVRFYSAALGRHDAYLIYLPPGYAAAARRGIHFPVLYLLHGDGIGIRHLAINMFKHGHIGRNYEQLLRKGQIKPFLIVMPEGGDKTPADDTEWANSPRGAFENLVIETVTQTDSRWSTIPSPAGRAIAGLSMGGYGAVNIALHHPGVFGTIESWSGYFTQTPTGVFGNASAQTLHDQSPAFYVRRLGAQVRAAGLHVLLYTAVSDPLIGQQTPFASQLRRYGASVTTASFRGIPHDYRLWGKKMPFAFRFASRWLQPPG